MDNLTHTLTGVILSRAGLNRICPRAAAILIVAVNAADLDVVSLVAGQGAYLHYHRGPLHSLVAMPFLALLVLALVRLVSRKPLLWRRAWIVALIGVASNPLLDCVNTYGVRLLWPFSDRWINGDFIAIFDFWVFLLLVTAVLLPWLLALVSSEIGAKASPGRGMAVFALCAICFYGFGHYLLHERALAVLDSRLYRGQIALRVGAFPTAFNPFRWTGAVEGREYFEIYPALNLLQEFDPTSGSIYYKPDPRSELLRARATPAFRTFLAFSQWTLWRVEPVSDPEPGTRVEAIDFRFGTPESAPFAAAALFDSQGRLLRSSLRF